MNYHYIRIGSDCVAVGSRAQCMSYYKRRYWGHPDGWVCSTSDKSVRDDMIRAGAKVLGRKFSRRAVGELGRHAPPACTRGAV